MLIYFFVVTSRTFCPPKGRIKKHKGNNGGVARLRTLPEKQSCFVLQLSPIWRMCLWDAPLCGRPSAFFWGGAGCASMRVLWRGAGSGVCSGWRLGVRELSVCLFAPRVRKAPCCFVLYSGMRLLRRNSKAMEWQAHSRNVMGRLISESPPTPVMLYYLPQFLHSFSPAIQFVSPSFTPWTHTHWGSHTRDAHSAPPHSLLLRYRVNILKYSCSPLLHGLRWCHSVFILFFQMFLGRSSEGCSLFRDWFLSSD